MNDLLLGLAFLAVLIFNTHTIAVKVPDMYVYSLRMEDIRWRIAAGVTLFVALCVQILCVAGVARFWGL